LRFWEKVLTLDPALFYKYKVVIVGLIKLLSVEEYSEKYQ
jgi:hypothetical protein